MLFCMLDCSSSCYACVFSMILFSRITEPRCDMKKKKKGKGNEQKNTKKLNMARKSLLLGCHEEGPLDYRQKHTHKSKNTTS